MRLRGLLKLILLTACASAQNPSSNPPPKVPTVQERIEVTATRLPEEPENVPAPIEVFNGDELRARGVRDLRSALALAIGVEIAPGGDGGPAGTVPAFWGLKEFDAFLLVVDGVPWGGAFNPALTTLDLNDVERIEVLRGPAPVTYGATSFVGVIQVVHEDPAASGRTLTLHGGSFGSGGAAFSTPIPLPGPWSSRLSLDGQREGFNDDRTSYRRGHGLWRVGRKTSEGRFWFNTGVNWLDQNPASPRLREGAGLSPLVPVDSNQNPAGAFLNDHRFTGMMGLDRSAAGGQWSTTGSVSHSRQDIFRGFVAELANTPDNARGLREKINLTDVYVDSHLSWKIPHALTLLLGSDYLGGAGNARGADFSYTVPINGAQAVRVPRPNELDVTINDYRNFFGPYASLEWRPLERLRVDGGLRLNLTNESRDDADLGAGTSQHRSRTDTRASASIAAMFTAWEHDQDSLGLFVNYRDTFKPAAIDFGVGGPPASGERILKPEASRSVQGGLKGRLFDRRVELEASGFLMNFTNLVTAVSINGLPARINAGEEQFKGFESGVSLFLGKDLMARASYSFHDARFTDFVQDFDGVPTQLAGNRLEMSPRHLVSGGLYHTPLRGLLGGVGINFTGSRFLNKRNTALADGFATVDLSAGYRTPRWECRVDARNVGDRRDPVAESELGDAQYYLMTNRRVDASFTVRF